MATSSDEEVYWGPYTFKESKQDLRRNKARKPSARRTIGPLPCISASQNSLETANTEELPENINSLSLSPDPSFYTTPRDSMSNNSDFLKEVSQAITAPSPACSYYTTIDQSNLENTFLKKVATNLTCKPVNSQPTYPADSPIDNNNTYFCHVEQNSTCDLDNIQHTLVENTIILSDDDEREQNVPSNSLNELQDSLNFVSVKKEKKSNIKPVYIVEDIIEIGDDSCSDIEEGKPTNYDSESNNSRAEQLEEIKNSGDHITIETSFKNLEKRDSERSNESLQDDYSFGLQIDLEESNWSDNDSDGEAHMLEKSVYETSYKRPTQTSEEYSFNLEDSECSVNSGMIEDDQVFYHVNHEDYVEMKQKQSVSNIAADDKQEPPSISQHYSFLSAKSCSVTEHHSDDITQTSTQSDEKSLESGVFTLNSSNFKTESSREIPQIEEQFDDTLEEMNRFLAQGCLDSSSESVQEANSPVASKLFSQTPPKTVTTSIPMFKSENKYLNIPVTTKPFNSAGHKQKYFDFDKIPTPPTTHRKNLFKLPPTPITNKTTNPQYRNILSPVGVYIKNTPKYTPMIRVHDKQLSNIPVLKSKIFKSKENIAPNKEENVGISSVFYKPSKSQENTTLEDIILPASIKTMCLEPILKIHERKFTSRNVDVEKMLKEDKDVTLDCTVDSSVLGGSTHDMSVWTTKQAFINK